MLDKSGGRCKMIREHAMQYLNIAFPLLNGLLAVVVLSSRRIPEEPPGYSRYGVALDLQPWHLNQAEPHVEQDAAISTYYAYPQRCVFSFIQFLL